MFTNISWSAYLQVIAIITLVYYSVIAWLYRKDLLQWWKEKTKK